MEKLHRVASDGYTIDWNAFLIKPKIDVVQFTITYSRAVAYFCADNKCVYFWFKNKL